MKQRLTDERIRDWREMDVRWFGVNRLRVVCDELLERNADFERCSDHAATLGIENEELLKEKRLMEERCNRYRGSLDEEMHLGFSYYDKYKEQGEALRLIEERDHALRDAVQDAVQFLPFGHARWRIEKALRASLACAVSEANTEGGGDD